MNNQLGRKIYYETTNGVVVYDRGEMSGDVQETTQEQDAAIVPLIAALAGKNALGCLALAYGQDSDKFAACHGYYIDPATDTVVFL